MSEQRAVVPSAESGKRVQANEGLLGEWELVSYELTVGGRTVEPWGHDVEGRLCYERGGRMWVHMMKRDRPRYAPGTASLEQVAAAAEGYIGYCGRYVIEQDAGDGTGTVLHRIEVAALPSWVGTDQRRHFDADGERLVLYGRIDVPGQTIEVRIAWKRARR
jgi:lipocalin-like protein